MRIKECCGIIAGGRPGGCDLVHRHRKACNFVQNHNSLAVYGSLMASWVQAAIDALWRNELAAARHLCSIAREKATKIEDSTRALQQRQVREHFTGGPEKNFGVRATQPKKEAYRWIRGSAGWTRSPIGDPSLNDAVPCGTSAIDELDEITIDASRALQTTKIWKAGAELVCDQADVELEANQWASLWKEGQLYECNFDELYTDQITILVANNFRLAAMTFPIGTGLGCDNIAPRALCRLSDELLNDLGRLLPRCETEGICPLMH